MDRKLTTELVDEKTGRIDLLELNKDHIKAEYFVEERIEQEFRNDFNTKQHTLVFGWSDPRTLEPATLKAIVKHVKKTLGVK